MGYDQQEIDHGLDQLIDSSIEEMKQIATPRYIYRVYNLQRSKEKGLFIGNSLELKGNGIKNHLKDSSEVVILAATLGPQVERQIRKYQLVDMTRTVILDACASEAIEGVCDKAQDQIQAMAMEKGYHITSRFSPGYGDLPIEMQSKIINYIEAPSKIGLSTTQENLLIPRKSVTAFIGLNKKPIHPKTPDCSNCNLYGNCTYGKKGRNCGDFR